MTCFEQLVNFWQALILRMATFLLISLQYIHKPSIIGNPSHTCFLLSLGISDDIPHILFYFSVPNKGKERELFHFWGKF